MNPEIKLYNEAGQVEDPDIAHEMAKTEDPYHKKSFFGLIKPGQKKLKEGEAAAEKVGETLVEEKRRNAAEQAEIKKAEEYEPKPPISIQVDQGEINNYSNEAKMEEATRLVNEIMEKLVEQGLAELPYKREVLFAEIHGFPALSNEEAELVVNGPMRRLLENILEKKLVEKGAKVDLLRHKGEKMADDTTLGVRVFQNHEDGSYGADYRKSTYSYQSSKMQVYFTRNAFEY